MLPCFMTDYVQYRIWNAICTVIYQDRLEMTLALCMLGNLLLSSADFFQNQLFQKILSGKLSECQTV